jgi:cellulose synthase/poly-beta-1,6-N-acetylglucosamine synthase-like glycosyltransferase
MGAEVYPDIVRLLAPILAALDVSILVYFVAINAAYVTLVGCATGELIVHILRIRGESRARILGSAVTPSISILAPAYNEEATIAESVTALLALHYANLELVVINDGSPDRTLEVLQQRFDLVPIHSIVWKRIETKPVRGLYRSRSHPNLLVVDKVNGGKADALNVGLNLATGDLVCVIDADTIVDADALQRLARPFLSHHDVLAAGGTIRIANGSKIASGRVTEPGAPRDFVAGVQVVEYFRAFIFGRLGWNRLGGNLIISGAFGLFRRDAMIAAGGYTHDTASSSSPTRWRGPSAPTRCACSGASATAGIVGSPTCSGATGACSSIRATGSWASGATRTSSSSSCWRPSSSCSDGSGSRWGSRPGCWMPPSRRSSSSSPTASVRC